MFRFEDVPAGSPASAGLHAGSVDAAKDAIRNAWEPLRSRFPWDRFAHGSRLNGGVTRLSRALFIDMRCKMPLSACESMLGLYLALSSKELQSRDYVGQLPQHHRRIVAEVVSSAASISAAQRRNYHFFANRSDLNALIPNCWIKPWNGKGPDFLMSGPHGVAFLEIKGSTLPNDLSFADFVSNKAQSVNAELNPFGIQVRTRYLLSQVFAPPREPVSVHWFNANEGREDALAPAIRSVLLIATGLVQFVGQMRNAGYDASALLKGEFVLAEEARDGPGLFLAPKRDGDFLIGISYTALRLYDNIGRFFLRLRARDTEFGQPDATRARWLARRLLRLRQLRPRDGTWRDDGFKPIHIYETGIVVFGP